MDCPFLGQIQLFALGFQPLGWQLCNGATLPVSQNQALYSLIGNKFGGVPNSTFVVPNMLKASAYQSKSPRPMAYFIAIEGLYPQRS
ncbi:Tail Collar domain protein [Ruminiclostridium papyrosolvens DSM 2782]|uniref:Tail Collar domain protein n=1 Tax=Ruminiclostridium papyrosolvens DSM 2782 TaxID=588581 RepID=F1TGA0_9FIRM|nr:phage tail protein [Ruminiclostridium papyrosolvens]EGD46465.1 Tail Collar domain protein [Ruminiclostridium papyrosolvens DSM 2782]WES35196.1 phage tail protein [Ruminiclostridium papyrosolvens DSM 2782]